MPTAYTFEVSLLEVKPRLWRRFLLHEPATFAELHDAIQVACEWTNSHLYRFHTKRKHGEIIAGVPMNDGFDDELDPDSEKVRVRSYFEHGVGASCFYEYDFGDCWWHEVKLVEMGELPPRKRRVLVAGEGTFPPEDCGGLYGYEVCIAAATGTGWKKEYGPASERKERLEWLGGWTPTSFDFAQTKKSFDR